MGDSIDSSDLPGRVDSEVPRGYNHPGNFPRSLKNDTGRIQEEKPDEVVTFEILYRS